MRASCLSKRGQKYVRTVSMRGQLITGAEYVGLAPFGVISVMSHINT